MWKNKSKKEKEHYEKRPDAVRDKKASNIVETSEMRTDPSEVSLEITNDFFKREVFFGSSY
jgi:hypothetical protein